MKLEKESKTKEKKCGLTQEKLSEIIDVSPSYISEIERGSSISSLSTISKISQVLDIDLDYLIFGITKNNFDAVHTQLLDTIPQKNKKLFADLCEAIANVLKNQK